MGDTTALDIAMAGQDSDDDEPCLDLGLPETEAVRAITERRGRGRPPGARNRRTVLTVDRLLAARGDPRDLLLSIAFTPVEKLAASLGCSPLEALREVKSAAVAVLPYLAQRQPIAVALTDHKVVNLTIMEAVAREAGEPLDLDAQILDVVDVGKT